MSPETSDAGAASQSKPAAGARPGTTDENQALFVDEQEQEDQERRRAKARLKLRVAQVVAAVLGVLILIVVGLMVILALRKYAEKNAEPNSWSAAQQGLSQLQSSARDGNAEALRAAGLVAPSCDLVSSDLDSARLVLIFDGQAAECSRLIIINTNTGALVLDRPIKG